MAVGFQKRPQSLPQIVDVFGNPIGKIPVFGLRPHELDWIEFRRVRRQPLRLKPGVSRLLQLGGSGTMNIQAVPHQEHRPAQAAVDEPQKSHHIVRMTVMIQNVVVQAEASRPGSDRQSADDAQPVVSLPRIMDRGLSHRSPSLPPQGLQKKATFIEKSDASLPSGSLFLAVAIRSDASAPWRLRRIPVRGVRVFERSSQVGATACRRNRRDSSCGTSSRSRLSPLRNSIPAWKNPTDPRRHSSRPPSVSGQPASVLAEDRGADAPPVRRRPRPQGQLSNASRKKHLIRPPQPLSSACPLAQEAGLQFVDGLPAPRGFQVVS
jgi:hypothetical protein